MYTGCLEMLRLGAVRWGVGVVSEFCGTSRRRWDQGPKVRRFLHRSWESKSLKCGVNSQWPTNENIGRLSADSIGVYLQGSAGPVHAWLIKKLPSHALAAFRFRLILY